MDELRRNLATEGISRSSLGARGEVVNGQSYGLGVSDEDQTAELQQAINESYGKVLILEGEILYDPSIGIEISQPITILASQAKFIKSKRSDKFDFVIKGGGICIDVIDHSTIYSSETSHQSDRGIQIFGNDIDIGKIIVKSDRVGTGAGASSRNAVAIGKDDEDSVNVNIGQIVCENWDRPIFLNRLVSSKIGSINTLFYQRAVYIRSCRNLIIESGLCRGISPNSQGKAGDNAILIEARNGKYSSSDLWIKNFVAEDSGEHGFRVGGAYSIKNVWFSQCSSIRSGSAITVGNPKATEWHGGCGFKALGGTASEGEAHENIYFLNCLVEDCNVTPGSFPDGHGHGNYAGFQVAVCDGVTIVNCTVRSRNQQYSSGYGVEILASKNVRIEGTNILDFMHTGIRIYEATGYPGWNFGCTDITVNDCLINGLNAGIRIYNEYRVHENISVQSVSFKGVSYAIWLSHIDGAGSVVNSVFDFRLIAGGQSTHLGVRNTNNQLLRAIAPWSNTSAPPPAAIGSQWTSSTDGGVRFKKSDGWEVL